MTVPPPAVDASLVVAAAAKAAASATITTPKTCCICLEDIPPIDLARINGCDHNFCFECIKKWGTEHENKCPLCKARFTQIDRCVALVPTNKKQKQNKKNDDDDDDRTSNNDNNNTVTVKDRNQRSPILSNLFAPGTETTTALEGLLGKRNECE